MKVDKRHNMHGIPNANYCINMSCSDYRRIANEDLGYEFGRNYCTDWRARLNHSGVDPLAARDWYIQTDGEVTTLYFPTQEMAAHCEQLITLCRLKHEISSNQS